MKKKIKVDYLDNDRSGVFTITALSWDDAINKLDKVNEKMMKKSSAHYITYFMEIIEEEKQ